MRKGSKAGIIFGAYFLRYGYIALFLIMMPIMGKQYVLLCAGIMFYLIGGHSLLGYLLRWRHVYCAWQEIAHRKMTPFHNQWDKISKKEVFGLSIACGIMGMVSIVGWAFL